MAHPQDTRMAVRAAYLGGLPIEQAAEKHGVSLDSARRWKAAAAAAGDDWDKFQRASLIVSGGGFDQAMGRVAASVILRCEAIMDRLADDRELDPIDATKSIAVLADALSKAQAAAKRLMPESDRLAIETGAVKAFVELLVRLQPGAAEAALTAMDAYSRGER
ncbi:MAG: hypothetical protein RLY71_446 [Pseudomonadota bacterium]|jgi:uncharacterized protein YhaN